MKTGPAIWMLLLLAAPALAQHPPTSSTSADDPAQSMEQWMNDNLDDNVHGFFNDLEQRFEGTNIYELGSLKAVALQVLPVLREYEETEPYAVWLQAHLDDLDAATEMQRQMKTAPPPKFQRSFWFKEMEKRPWPPLAKTYVPQLKRVFVSEKVPSELVWVAGVESSFDPRARSPAGAAGMFQLMPATARMEHLSLWPFDQRYQPEKSAHAAARYLRELHRHYGDWRLALAAYNVGEGRVDKLLKEHKAGSFDAIARWLPAETQIYVPKVEATVRRREGRALTDLKD